MKKTLFLVLSVILTLSFVSCGNSKAHKYVNAEYEFTGTINGQKCRMRINLYDNGNARLQMIDNPEAEHLADISSFSRLRDGVNGGYYYSEEAGCFRLSVYDSVWYEESAMKYVSEIYIGNDGYLYFGREVWDYSSMGYISTGGAEDAKNHTCPGPRYTVKN